MSKILVDDALKLVRDSLASMNHEDSIFAGEFDEEIKLLDEVIEQPAPAHPWVGLTDEEIENSYMFWIVNQQDVIGFGKSLETKLKRKNT